LIDEVLISRIFNGTSIVGCAVEAVNDEAKIESLEATFSLASVSPTLAAVKFRALSVNEMLGITSVTIT
jgi:hypothetical protein